MYILYKITKSLKGKKIRHIIYHKEEHKKWNKEINSFFTKIGRKICTNKKIIQPNNLGQRISILHLSLLLFLDTSFKHVYNKGSTFDFETRMDYGKDPLIIFFLIFSIACSHCLFNILPFSTRFFYKGLLQPLLFLFFLMNKNTLLFPSHLHFISSLMFLELYFLHWFFKRKG